MAQSELSSWAFTGVFFSVFTISGSIPSPLPRFSLHTLSPLGCGRFPTVPLIRLNKTASGTPRGCIFWLRGDNCRCRGFSQKTRTTLTAFTQQRH